MVIDATDKFAKAAARALLSPGLIAYNGRTRDEEIVFRTSSWEPRFDALVADHINSVTYLRP